MAKTATVTAPTTEIKFPKFDLDALFSAQKANLAAAHEAQTVLLDAAEAIAKVQHGYLEGAVADAKAAVDSKEPPKAESVKATGDKFVAVAKEVFDLGLAAQKRVAQLVTDRTKATVAELQPLAA